MNIEIQKEIVSIECCNCGVVFWVSKKLQENWQENKQTFYCPNGHSQSYIKTTAQILSEQLQSKSSELFRKESEIFRLNKEVKRLKRKKK